MTGDGHHGLHTCALRAPCCCRECSPPALAPPSPGSFRHRSFLSPAARPGPQVVRRSCDAALRVDSPSHLSADPQEGARQPLGTSRLARLLRPLLVYLRCCQRYRWFTCATTKGTSVSGSIVHGLLPLLV
ncbi:hypothetical protein BDA96_09G116400 [Sorghum bicolor]|uniref:Uncharacterized protein n=2 Tax=Sorghum bicolor TaxID=4558 RepID=A0A921U498_SORBI|nr:hypothetical protein BDA96_09G116400 [Sorghum bicolor]OQU77844.1 hypothetical protein SORBI_3009G111050 [Sorghum bicolor]